jgi:hypothetical protein
VTARFRVLPIGARQEEPMRLPAFDADRSLYAAAGRYRAARTASGGAAGALVPARPKCSNCDDILDRCADNGGFPRAVCNACANGNCYEDGPVPVPPPGGPFGGVLR